ncbi:MAG TPA: DUF2332 domain-containing protein [Candidatus Dormibacteraeota bacterium]|nr:DUF2332 domain-containing protein [Candidatus Dormibacteraeota bacterium]
MLPATATLAERFRWHLPAFAVRGARLYEHLCREAADELERVGPLHDLLSPYAAEPPRRFLPLRLLAAVHGWVLRGDLPDLAGHYPSAGGSRPPDGAWPLFRAACLERAEELARFLALPLQHNEVARAVPLACGFDFIAGETGLPLRLLEVGASAGLLLRWDHYRDRPWFQALYGSRPASEIRGEVGERRGCDLHPIDPTDPDQALRLCSYVWADLPGHLRMLEEALEICREVPATVERASGEEWLERQLATSHPGRATVVFHSLLEASAGPETMARIRGVVRRAGDRATAEAPLAYLRFEAGAEGESTSSQAMMRVTVVLWPGGEERLLAMADVNGWYLRRP